MSSTVKGEINIHLEGCSWASELIYLKHLKYQAHNKCSLKINGYYKQYM